VYHFVVDVVFLARSLTKTRRAGGSLVVTLPKELVEAQKIREGEVIEITVRKIRVQGYGALKGIRSFTAEDELIAHGW
jgi:antitoxin component of MazEF toxin-antitoxin module